MVKEYIYGKEWSRKLILWWEEWLIAWWHRSKGMSHWRGFIDVGNWSGNEMMREVLMELKGQLEGYHCKDADN